MRAPYFVISALAMVSCAGGASDSTSVVSSQTQNSTSPSIVSDVTTGESDEIIFRAEVWADNWFSLYVDGELVGADSVSITTEKSFNSETFTFSASYPFDLNWVLMDFKENDSGLEYIGTDRQQIGDGGFIAQVTDTETGLIVAVTDANCRCRVIHQAPLNPECVSSLNPESECEYIAENEPDGWTETGYDSSSWDAAIEYGEDAVGVKDGYLDIKWSPLARLIWSADLKIDNTVLCRQTVADF